MSVEVKKLGRVRFKPYQTVGPLTLGEVDGKAAFTTLAGDWVWILPIIWMALPLILWIIRGAIWWWASSDLEYADISKVIGLFSPFFGTTAEALIK